MLTEVALRRSLRLHWGYSEFRPHQLAICQTISEGRDVFVVASTGSGKSLCYQLPPVTFNDIGIPSFSVVICPLISLMEDQVAHLNAMGIAAGFVGSTSTLAIERQALNGEFTVLYITPEKLSSWKSGLESICKRKQLISIAVDECHCVSEWGYDFRPAYRFICRIREWFPSVPLIALTATATKSVISDVIHNLRLHQPAVYNAGFNRPNLHYSVVSRQSDNDVVQFLVKYYRPFTSESENDSFDIPTALVYTHTRKDAERISQLLSQCKSLQRVRSAFYHAGMGSTLRADIHTAFSRDEIHIVVATIAFGMGINKPDVRLVVHCGMPASVEDYYQQTGRAGRDGEFSRCVLFHGRNDATRVHSIKLQGGQPLPGNMEKQVKDRIAEMEKYCGMDRSILICRRKFLLHHFGDDDTISVGSKGHCSEGRCCDLCDAAEADTEGGVQWVQKGLSASSSSSAIYSGECNEVNRGHDLGGEILLLLRAVLDCGEYFSLSTPIGILTGTKDKSILQKVRNSSTMMSYNSGNMHSKEWWKLLGDQLVDSEGMLARELTHSQGGSARFSFHKYKVTEKGKAFVWDNIEWQPASAKSCPDGGSSAGNCVVTYKVRPSPALQRLLYSSPGIWDKSTRATSHVATVSHSSHNSSSSFGIPGSELTNRDAIGASQSTGRRRGTLIRRSSSGFVQSPNTEMSRGAHTALPEHQSACPSSSDQDLFDDELKRSLEARVRKCRASISARMGPDVAPYSILSTSDINNIVKHRPLVMDELRLLPGWGEKKIQNFGAEVVACVGVFLRDMSLPLRSHMGDLVGNAIHTAVYSEEDSSAISSTLSTADKISALLSSGEREESLVSVKVELDERREDEEEKNLSAIKTFEVKNELSSKGSGLSAASIAESRQSEQTGGVKDSGLSPSIHVTSEPTSNDSAIPPFQSVPMRSGNSRTLLSRSISANPYSVGSMSNSSSSSPITSSAPMPPRVPYAQVSQVTPKPSVQIIQKRKKRPLLGKPPPGTKLRRVNTSPEAVSSSAQSEQSTLIADRNEMSLVKSENLGDSIVVFLKENPKSSFSDIVKGVTGSCDGGGVSGSIQKVREAVRELAESFYVYMDGDKYCVL